MTEFYRVGTANITINQTAVTGNLTGWNNQVLPGDMITFDAGDTWHEIAAVNSNTSLTLQVPYPNASVSSGAYAIVRLSRQWGLASALATRVANLLDEVESRADIYVTDGAPAATLGDDAPNAVAFDETNTKIYFRESGGAWDAGRALNGTGLPPGGNDGQSIIRDSSAPDGAVWVNVRSIATANLNLYVRTDGNDNNTGLSNTAGGAFRNISKAMSVVAATDMSGFVVTVNVGPGTYNEAVVLPTVIGGRGVLVGNTSNPASTGIQPTNTARAVTADNITSKWEVKGFVLSGASSTGCLYVRNAVLDFGDVQFNAIASNGTHITYAEIANGSIIGNYTIAGGCTIHMAISGQSRLLGVNRTVTLTGTPAFSNRFLSISENGQAQLQGMTYTGAATGTRYVVADHGLCKTLGGGANYLPGSVAGFTTVYGVYS